MRTTIASAALALMLGVVIGCGGDTPVATSPEAAAPGGAPAAPGAPGAPGEPAAPTEAPAADGAAPADGTTSSEGTPDGATTAPGDSQLPGGEGTPVPGDPNNPDATGQPGYAGDANYDPSQPTVLGKLGGSIFGIAAPFVGGGNPNAGGEGDTGALPGGDMPQRAMRMTLKERAMAAFTQGRDSEGLIWLHTHYLGAGEAELAEKMRWIPGLRRPGLAVRFGAGVIYTAPREFTGDPQPISPRLVAPDLSGGDGGGDEGGRRRRRQEQPAAEQPQAEPQAGEPLSGFAGRLDYYTGDVGTKFVAAVKQRFVAGDFGMGMKDVYTQPKAAVDPNDPNAAPGDAAEGIGSVGAIGGIGEGAADGEKKEDTTVGQIAPGFVWLGAGALKDLEKRAGEQNVDLLVIYDVTVKPARTASFANNTTKFRVVAVKAREVVFSSPQLNNLKALEERKLNKAKDMVDVEVERAMTAIEAKFKATEIPAGLKPEHVLSRISALGADPEADMLASLVEARFYSAKGLLPENDFKQFAASMLTAERMAPVLSQMQPGPMPFEMQRAFYDLSPEKGLELMQSMQRGASPALP